ncbi:Phenylacetaldoxime dehydratase-like protein [Emericellopsis cladophorae]|uniref:Phenylacetaldoxime dehydratase-like protein n=1 Tax=Emericellopsis cladophorae TaxID=2686198 RepID=A0A9P9XVA1_9HYPO|nr:Phenylacetaldoxime dehydratase-like protein [Emericellopsis cladophorae]KAI6778268.1 Phenylacetaldoxime dehydratase-like protein [Emericellopsis cladophorae]
MACPARTYPLNRPDGHQPPVPRWHLRFDEDVQTVHILYFGVQQASDSLGLRPAADAIVRTVRDRISDFGSYPSPAAVEEFEVIDAKSRNRSHVTVAYWTEEEAYRQFLNSLALSDIHDNVPADHRSQIGLWLETFSLPVTRLETNYSSLDYLPGLARLPKTHTEDHTLTAYWGAARDRIDASAHDPFSPDETSPKKVAAKGAHVKGSNANNLVHIRTGQFWHNCDEQEAEAYEKKLEPTLEKGLYYLRETPSAGAMGLRYLRNTVPVDDSSTLRKETCVTCFFSSLDKLEGWAKSHKSHLAIYNGAMRHAKMFGAERKFRTWHEVVVLKRGEAKFEYLNCESEEGMMAFC